MNDRELAPRLARVLSRRRVAAGLAAGAVGLAVRRPAAFAQNATPAATPATGPTAALHLGLVPGESQEEMLRQYQPLTDYIKNELEVADFEAFVGTDYTAVIEAMRADKLDAAFFGPFSYILAHDVAGARSLVMPGHDDGTPSTYNSLILASAKSGITDLAGLRGHSFTFVDPASTSGHLIPRANLVKAGIDPDKDMTTTFAGGHDASLLAINSGRVDAGAASEPQYRSMIEEGVIDEGNFVLLLRSDPIPESPFATRDDLDPAVTERLKRALLRFHEAVGPEVVGAILDQNGTRFVEAPDSLYDPIREVAKALNLTPEDLAQ